MTSANCEEGSTSPAPPQKKSARYDKRNQQLIEVEGGKKSELEKEKKNANTEIHPSPSYH